MAKVTLNPELPSETLIKQAAKEVTVTDKLGRALTLKKQNLLASSRLMGVIGGFNEGYINMHMPLVFLAAIDDDPVSVPFKLSEVEALIQRLDEDGYMALVQGIQEHFNGEKDAEKAEIKKS
jgi:hypothetical protein